MKLSSILIIENIPQQQVPLTNKCTTCQHLQQCYQNKVFTKLSTGQSDGLFLPICGNPGKSRGSRSRSCRHCVQVSWLRNTFQCGDKIYVCRAGGDSLVQAPLNTNKLNLQCGILSPFLEAQDISMKTLVACCQPFFTFDLSIDQNTEIMTKLQKDIS